MWGTAPSLFKSPREREAEAKEEKALSLNVRRVPWYRAAAVDGHTKGKLPPNGDSVSFELSTGGSQHCQPHCLSPPPLPLSLPCTALHSSRVASLTSDACHCCCAACLISVVLVWRDGDKVVASQQLQEVVEMEVLQKPTQASGVLQKRAHVLCIRILLKGMVAFYVDCASGKERQDLGVFFHRVKGCTRHSAFPDFVDEQKAKLPQTWQVTAHIRKLAEEEQRQPETRRQSPAKSKGKASNSHDGAYQPVVPFGGSRRQKQVMAAASKTPARAVSAHQLETSARFSPLPMSTSYSPYSSRPGSQTLSHSTTARHGETIEQRYDRDEEGREEKESRPSPFAVSSSGVPLAKSMMLNAISSSVEPSRRLPKPSSASSTYDSADPIAADDDDDFEPVGPGWPHNKSMGSKQSTINFSSSSSSSYSYSSSYRGPTSELVGMRNVGGNSCYMNAILQSLFAQPSFTRSLLHSLPFTFPSHSLYSTLAALARLHGKEDRGVIDPEPLKEAMGTRLKRFAGNRQQDAHEFLMEALNARHRGHHADAFLSSSGEPAKDRSSSSSSGQQRRPQRAQHSAMVVEGVKTAEAKEGRP